MPNAFLSGESVYLRPLETSDAAAACGWLNDPEIRTHIRRDWPINLAGEQCFIDSMSQSEHDLVLAVVLRDEDQFIGLCGLHKIDSRNRHAEFGILLGEKEKWGRGLGREATSLLVGYAFDTLNLNRVWLHVYEDNPRAIRCYEKLCFRHEGTLRQDDYRNGSYRNTLAMALLRSEWTR